MNTGKKYFANERMFVDRSIFEHRTHLMYIINTEDRQITYLTIILSSLVILLGMQ